MFEFPSSVLLAYADDVSPRGDNRDTIKNNAETLIDANKEVGIEVNLEKTKYMLMSRYQTAGQNRGIRIGNNLNVSSSSSLGATALGEPWLP
jgi:hypothetical protein